MARKEYSRLRRIYSRWPQLAAIIGAAIILGQLIFLSFQPIRERQSVIVPTIVIKPHLTTEDLATHIIFGRWTLRTIAGFVQDGLFGNSNYEVTAGPENSQQRLKVRLRSDIRALDRGVLSYRFGRSIHTGASAVLTVSLKDIGKHPILSEIRSNAGVTTVYPHNVPTGGIVGLWMSSCVDLACHPLTDTRQAAVVPGQTTSWNWEISAYRPGQGLMTITASIYAERSTIAIRENVISIAVRVAATVAYERMEETVTRRRELGGITGLIDTTAGLITTIGGAIAVLAGGLTWLARRRKKKITETTDKATATVATNKQP